MTILAIPFLLTLSLKLTTSAEFYFLVFHSFLFSHYVFAVTSLRNRSISFQKGLLLAFSITVFGFLVFYLGFPIEIYFGIHWLFGELYLRPQKSPVFEGRALYLTVFYGLLYTQIFDAWLGDIEKMTLATIVFVLVQSYFFSFKRVSKESNLLSVLYVDTLYYIFALVCWSIATLNFLDIIFLHLWQFFVFYLIKTSKPKRFLYLFNSIWLTFLFAVFAHPANKWFLGGLDIVNHAALFGYFHITQSFFSSKSNPSIIRHFLERPFYGRV